MSSREQDTLVFLEARAELLLEELEAAEKRIEELEFELVEQMKKDFNPKGQWG